MKYCYRCGVKLAESARECPLCGTAVPEDSQEQERGAGESNTARYRDKPWPPDDAGAAAHYPIQPGAARLFARQILLVVFMTPALAIIAISFVAPGSIEWLGYALAGLVAVWAVTTVPLAAYGHPWLIVGLEIAVVIALMVVVDLFSPPLSWSLDIGLPIVALSAGVSFGVTLSIVHMRERKANVAAVILSGVALSGLGLDLIISNYRGSAPGWSFVGIAALFPVICFLVYYHRSLRRRVPLGRRFHL